MSEVISIPNILDYAIESEEQKMTVATAIAQRMLNLRQDLSEQQVYPIQDTSDELYERYSFNPRQDEVNLLEELFIKRPHPLPYEVWGNVQIPTYFQNERGKGWQLLARCLGEDPDLFMPERGASGREAKEMCNECVARGTCLEFALFHGEKFGIWGGTNERERRRIRRVRTTG